MALVDYSDTKYWRKWRAKCALGKLPHRSKSETSLLPPKKYDRFGGDIAPYVPLEFPVVPSNRGPNYRLGHIFIRTPKIPDHEPGSGNNKTFATYMAATSAFGHQPSLPTAGASIFARTTAPLPRVDGCVGPGAYAGSNVSSFGVQASGVKRSSPFLGFGTASRAAEIKRAERGAGDEHVPGPIYDVVAAVATGKNKPAFSLGTRPHCTVKHRSPGPVYEVPSVFGKEGSAGAYFGPAFRAPPPPGNGTESRGGKTPPAKEFVHFGYGCNLEEHVQYGHCLDMKCSTRSPWEQTHAVQVALGGKAARKGKARHRRRVGNSRNLDDGLDKSGHAQQHVSTHDDLGTLGDGARHGDQGRSVGRPAHSAVDMNKPASPWENTKRPVSRPASRLAMSEPPRLRAQHEPVGTEFVGKPPPVQSGTAVHFATDKEEVDLIGKLMKVSTARMQG